MHDAVTAERQGIPAVSVMTSAFVDAAQLMAQVQGVPDHPFVVIDHPIASATPEGLAQRALVATEAAAELLLGGASPAK